MVPCHDESLQNSLSFPGRETSCTHQALKMTAIKKVERQAGKRLWFSQRSFLHYVMLLEIEAELTRWSPLWASMHSRPCKLALMWCDLQGSDWR